MKRQEQHPQTLNPNWANLKKNINPNAIPPKNPHAKTPEILSRKRKNRNYDEGSKDEEEETVLMPTSDDTSLTQVLGMDCEMVGVGPGGTKSALGRVTLVNKFGNVVYDEYVRPLEYVENFRTHISGIRPWDMKKAKFFMTVQKKVAELIKGRIIVGHALHHDLKVLLLSHPKKDIRDTSTYPPFLRKNGKKNSLKHLAAEILGAKIQQQQHCPVQDARAAMLIYMKYQKEWEKNIKRQDELREKLKKRKKKSTNED